MEKTKTHRQLSAGGVVVRRQADGFEVVLIEVRTKGGRLRWTLPKGLVEEGENIARTAHREVKEETGLDGRIIEKIDSIHYFYAFRDGQELKRYFKIVYFFLMEYTGGDTKDHDSEVLEARWFNFDEAMQKVSFEDEREILKKAKQILIRRNMWQEATGIDEDNG